MKRNLVDKYFDEWTAGLDEADKRIRVFERVRDIPYAIIPELRDPIKGPKGILKKMCGSCTPKHFLLGLMFERLGVPIKYVTYPFSWDVPEAKYPPELRALAKGLATEYHLALKAAIGGRWVVVDATWDLPLVPSGLPVNASWDGASDTLLAVTPTGEIEHEGASDRDAFVAEKKGAWPDEEHARMNEFYSEFNRWLEATRHASERGGQ